MFLNQELCKFCSSNLNFSEFTFLSKEEYYTCQNDKCKLLLAFNNNGILFWSKSYDNFEVTSIKKLDRISLYNSGKTIPFLIYKEYIDLPDSNESFNKIVKHLISLKAYI